MNEMTWACAEGNILRAILSGKSCCSSSKAGWKGWSKTRSRLPEDDAFASVIPQRGIAKVMGLLLKARNALRSNMFFMKQFLKMRGLKPEDFVVTPGLTQICIEGSPRSANSFAVLMFWEANPGVPVAHHTHSPGNLRLAISRGIPALALIRNPRDAIVSSVIASDRNSIEDEVSRYIMFYKWVAKNIDTVAVTDFREVTTDFNKAILKTNKKFEAAFNLIDDVKKTTEDVFSGLKGKYAKLTSHENVKIRPIPYNQRKKVKQTLLPEVIDHPRFAYANRLYEDIVNAVYH
jgi:hypothetical protein